MRKSWLLCVLLGTLAWGQAAPSAAPPPQPAQTPAAEGFKPQAPAPAPDTSASVPPDAPVITVNGVCPAAPKPVAAKGTAVKPASATKTSPADCKTVITKAQFEKLANSIAPTVTPQLKRQLAGVLPRYIAMSAEARKQGLDKTDQFKETVKFAQMQILTNELQHKVQDQASKISDADIKTYYDGHPNDFEQYNLDRLFVPRSKQEAAEAKDDDKDEKLSEEAQKAKEAADKAKAEEGEQAMTKLADELQKRAVAGEDFAKLQKEAFDAAGMKIESPTVNLPSVRRTGLPPGHASVFDLKAGEVSPVINDAGGHYIYKVNSKEVLPLDQKVTTEIHSKLQNERTKEMMDKLNGSFKVETSDAYFGPGGVGVAPPPRLPRPHMAPGGSPSAPPAGPGTAPTAQTPPPAQPTAAKPN
jgi:hypothetical protein